MENRTYRIEVSGRVQGVAFRHYTKLQAERTGVTGWVKNLNNDSVEAVISGSKEQIDVMITWFHAGSPSAVVANVSIFEIEDPDHYNSFDIHY